MRTWRQDEVWRRERERAEAAASPVVQRLHNQAAAIEEGVP